jgi:catechol 2,3-dioxygenase-like lactoylglutathione lyase family enzyme
MRNVLKKRVEVKLSAFRLMALVLIVFIGAWNSESQVPQETVTGSDTPAIRFIDHVGINVTDLQRSADWYGRVLGFTVFRKWTTTWMIRRGNMRIGLFLRPNAAKIEDLDNKLAITHFAFLTSAKGFKEAQSTLSKLGIKFAPPEDTGIAHSIFINDPDGYQIEITTYYK